MKKFLLIILIGIYSSVAAQTERCRLVLKGQLVVSGTRLPIVGAIVGIDSLNKKSITDEHGRYSLAQICPGNYVLTVSDVGYKAIIEHTSVKSHTTKNFELDADAIHLHDVEVVGHRTAINTTTTVTTIRQSQLDQAKGGSLAEVLKTVPGVTSLQTGSTIAKPVINGLHSTRVLILNNGVRQEGQQWGFEHAPEIDPFIANQITVVKGAEAVRYGSEAMGGVVIIEPPSLPNSNSIAGELNVVGSSNGRAGAVSGMLNGGLKKIPGFGWRVQGTTKKAGNIETGDYYLLNTGVKELNFSGAAGYFNNVFGADVYYSHFNSDIGIFSGAHVGSLADLEYRLQLGRPDEQGDFSYGIDVPKQVINHDLLKVRGHVHLTNHSKLNLLYGLQQNKRQEYDIRRGGRSNIPSLDMHLTTQTLDVSFENFNHGGWKTIVGVNGLIQVNNNIPGTGVTPLIPNFDTYGLGAYGIQRFVKEEYEVEAGLRYDYKSLDALGYDSEQNLYGGKQSFNNLTASLGGVLHLGNGWDLRSNVGSAWRPPTVNELYSNGLHHGVAAIERGNRNLASEQSLKWITTIDYKSKALSFDVNLFAQSIKNYIYLQSSNERVVSLRGTFPVFNYEQTNARYYGVDVFANYRLSEAFDYELKGSLIRAKDVGDDKYLPWIPGDRVDNTIRWHLNKGGRFQNAYVQFQHQYVARQNRYELNSDYSAPPPAYQLLNAAIGTTYLINGSSVNFNISANNLANVLYKDYMNRFRYYSHDIGRNITLRMIYKF